MKPGIMSLSLVQKYFGFMVISTYSLHADVSKNKVVFSLLYVGN